MDAIRTKGRKLLANDKGATAIEYGLICALIVIAMIAGLKSLGGGSNGMWAVIGSKVEDSAASSS